MKIEHGYGNGGFLVHERLNPCSNGMMIELSLTQFTLTAVRLVLILVLME